MSNRLIYVHDPMCSWCWGFTDTYQALVRQLPGDMIVLRLLGGLAPDSDEVMNESTQMMIQQAWQRIEQMIPGKRFNYDFWIKCQPRRATYPACRAVIAAREQGEHYDVLMTSQIQKAYYQQARNPSDSKTLIELSAELGLDSDRFAEQLTSVETQNQLMAQISTVRSMGISGFPSLVLDLGGRLESLLVNYTDVGAMLVQIESSLDS